MCNSPLYRLVLVDGVAEKLPPKFRARVRGNGVIISRSEYEYFRDVVGVLPEHLQTIPCGCCLGCKTDYQNVWSTRIQLEASLYKHNYFITLTYNEENVPKTLLIDTVSGRTAFYNTLLKSDFSAFIKRLRASLAYRRKSSCRFLACGEYGENGLRPHFHFIGCDLDLSDLQYFYSKGRKGAFKTDYKAGDEVYYRSALVEQSWNNGFCLVARVIPENCSYVASYVNKQVTPSEVKLSQTAENYYVFSRDFGKPCSVMTAVNLGLLQSPFLHMSRRPGLARAIFDREEQKYYFAFDTVKPRKNVKLFKKHFRYFDDILKKRHELLAVVLKDKRKRKTYSLDSYCQWDRSDLALMQRREEVLLLKQKNKKKREL